MVEYGIADKFIGFLCLSDVSISHNSFPQLSGNAARLYEKHEVISKQANHTRCHLGQVLNQLL